MSKIDEIDKFAIVELTEKTTEDDKYYVRGVVKDSVKAALLADMLELVGEDDHKWLQATPSQRTVSESLNALRQELRDKLKEYYGDTNG